jgi:hypothetical protein
VLAKDSAALLGLAIAALGIWLSHRLDMPALDGAASLQVRWSRPDAIRTLNEPTMQRRSRLFNAARESREQKG